MGDYTATCWFYLESYPKEHYEQVLSAWCPGEDPLRITIEGEELFARIEGFGTGGTPRVRVELGRWVHAAAVKEGAQLTLYVDGVSVGSTAAPAEVLSRSTEIAIGANPLYTGHEYLRGRVDDLHFYARALSAEEVQSAFAGSAGPAMGR
jgi:hyaluronoglucosaminidase